MWRYFELLPIADKGNIVNLGTGYTPLHKSDNLAKKIGLRELYVKDDTVNPTGSFKDRPASVAVSKALEFKGRVVGCPSTGNLASAVAAHAAKANLRCYVLMPSLTEREKILQAIVYGAKVLLVRGTYDDINRLSVLLCENPGVHFVNINIRPFYMEGSKTLAFETCEQLGWEAPDYIVVPTASGGLLYATWKALRELEQLGLVDNANTRLICAQPEGCSPIVDAFKSSKEVVEPVEKPSTIAKSLAIGNPAEGNYVLRILRQHGGNAESVTDDEIKEGIEMLGREGIFTEPAGGVSVAVLKKLVDNGTIGKDDKVVCFVTATGLKAVNVVPTFAEEPLTIEADARLVGEVLKAA
jgi:threonine synthase